MDIETANAKFVEARSQLAQAVIDEHVTKIHGKYLGIIPAAKHMMTLTGLSFSQAHDVIAGQVVASESEKT